MSRELAIARFINWPMEVMGEAFKLISHLGGYLLDGVRALRNVVREAGGGAIRTVVEALERIAGKLSHIAEQVLGRVGGALSVAALGRSNVTAGGCSPARPSGWSSVS